MASRGSLLPKIGLRATDHRGMVWLLDFLLGVDITRELAQSRLDAGWLARARR